MVGKRRRLSIFDMCSMVIGPVGLEYNRMVLLWIFQITRNLYKGVEENLGQFFMTFWVLGLGFMTLYLEPCFDPIS